MFSLGRMQNKTKERDGKIQILLVIIQGLISACGFQWGAFEYFVQVIVLLYVWQEAFVFTTYVY